MLLDVDNFNQFARGLNETVGSDVLQINYSVYLAEKYLKLHGVRYKQLVDFLLDPSVVCLSLDKVASLKEALAFMLNKQTFSNILNDIRYTKCLALLHTVENCLYIKVKDLEVLLVAVNSLYIEFGLCRASGTVNDQLWASEFPALRRLLKLDGFPYSNQMLINTITDSSVDWYSKLVEQVNLCIVDNEPYSYGLINEIISGLLLQSSPVKKDLKLSMLIDSWITRQDKEPVDASVVENYVSSFLESKENLWLLSNISLENEKLKFIKRSIKSWKVASLDNVVGTNKPA